ncbi:ATP-dependent nuclease [Streptomyces sp. NBC_01744]|uniref:ATP-dependent nuclease n=1 Tax=Streptomyces sp. NBC_01744 TaxID=2975927 RepID=UPI003D9A479B|nr:AAA family ATPase [Streptomyces sp. NBC_01744]
MLKQVKLRNFKAFENFSITLKEFSLLVGPNSAGKSTILSALKFAEACLRSAKRSKFSLSRQHGGTWVQGYPIPLKDFELLNESVRHEFRETNETTLELIWQNGCRLRAVWPRDDYDTDSTPFFYLLDASGRTPRTVKQVRDEYTPIGIIPALTPLEHEEEILTAEYVRKNLASRLSSRHFRNQLRILSSSGDDWRDFLDFAEPWMGGMQIAEPVAQYGPESSIDVFYTEPGSGREKELVWAGDGVQIWLQLLLHVYRLKESPTLILDEPEVFLHADLQRRLVRLIDSLGIQVVLATHSSEVLAEADSKSIVWIDKSKRHAIRAPRKEGMETLSASLGTAFNLGMAKALRAKGVVFVEGKDLRTLRILAKNLGYTNIVADMELAVVPINGYSNWRNAEAFGWLVQDFLKGSIGSIIVLDRDYRTQSQVSSVTEKLTEAGLECHVWSKKELESYLISPSAISRISGCPLPEVERVMTEIMDPMQGEVFAKFNCERQSAERSGKMHEVNITAATLAEFAPRWAKVEYRRSVCPPKEIMSELNKHLQNNKHKAVSFDALAKHIRQDELPDEMLQVLHMINTLAS